MIIYFIIKYFIIIYINSSFATSSLGSPLSQLEFLLLFFKEKERRMRNHSLADFNHTTSRSLSKKRGILEAAATLLSAVLTKQQTARFNQALGPQ